MSHGQLINAHLPPPAGPRSMFAGFWRERRLIAQLIRRDVLGRYRGSIMGVAWSFLYPVLMLAVYTFVFSVVFEAKWPGSLAGQGKARFALLLFIGVIAHGLIAEALIKAPSLIVGNTNYVKKVVFPLETLAWSLMGSAVFHALASLTILMVAKLLLEGSIPLTALWLPVILLPLVLFALGISWLLASLGVFIRDIGQMTGVVSTVLMFLAPVFYPIASLPEKYRAWVYANPITVAIEESRAALFTEIAPDPAMLIRYYAFALVFMAFGYWWFQKSRRGFADVL
ncbi:ABC transporter permease [Lysobacter sp. 5GHs7-4]|uniref:ABC transporter permease n=1 Tax=Lysobacter sp. 5GHs7-4 TaxID=2904253 RepID=UPI001E479BBE|nr:ABC transporter permease [Lysobacter sp. 5GHs7-4]UHQ22694.1 ABC transporter permease [Lysobacter sp. 5GHs7-4]